jgi:hypothetical protein
VIVNGLHLSCDCYAAKHGRYCAHRAAVHARLLLEAAVRCDTCAREIERALHEAACALNVRPEKWSGLRGNTQVISPWR